MPASAPPIERKLAAIFAADVASYSHLMGQDEAGTLRPTAWVLAAEARWKPDGAHGLSMTAMALDPAGGGRDSAELARRRGGWYAELISAKGKRRQTAPRRRLWLFAIAWTVRL